MRKVATLMAVGASFALATAASAASISVTGSNLPGTNTYTITMTWDTAENVAGIATSVTTTGTYTGAFTETIPAAFVLPLPGPTVPGGGTGVAGSWGGATFGTPVAGGTYTIGTFEVTVAAGNTIAPFLTGSDGIAAVGGGSVATTLSSAITIVPEPTTAALLGLGLAGLVVVGRRSRA